MDISFLKLRFFEKEIIIEKPKDLNSLLDSFDENRFSKDDQLPYWAELWPSSIYLARWLWQQKELIKNKFCLDLGCGLGVSSIITSLCKAKVVGMDYFFDSLRFAQRNGENNNASVLWTQMDWKYIGFKRYAFHYILGSDIIYEKRNFKPILGVLKHCLKQQGKFWLCAPKRKVSLVFFEMLNKNGFFSIQKGIRSVNNINIYLWEIKKQGEKR